MPLYSLLTRIPRSFYIAAALTLYLLLLWMGGHQSTVDHLPGRADFSKVYHLVFYSGWCCLAWLSLRRPGIAAAVALTVLAGAGDEFHQYFLPFREARLSDVLIDGCAALAGALSMHALRRRAMALEKSRIR
ncbi:VanZ family protein [Noviherbaspirillum suwonense]|jgi:VanZ family protein|uniref:VanZ like family protein n=1 Tax=Noviherbaspirillum suwonense TaxID=1224511 RepID=A0ABY1QK02_9BURK|nr:VanZ family protein [Noviherbaspirillum suwonense]SMP73927.1 VanZ like family protein [Noviherbaspirillum suwonense]